MTSNETEGQTDADLLGDSSPKPELQVLAEPSPLAVWLIGGLGLLASLSAAALATMAVMLRGWGDGSPGPAPGVTGFITLWSPAVYFGLLTASCRSSVDEERMDFYLLLARITLGVFCLFTLVYIIRHDGSVGPAVTFYFAVLAVVLVCEGFWAHLRRRKQWLEL